ncbi:hypothetical protein D9757_001949 [Collybiopsis confluens]|uniref:Uncharacterized protein n=1 Tax=Collybiopsis confluens TaxID=2823264 RepID=A0A8H5HXZ7_9AGAR|nr:hypothetical protein D9757_001949 [Collybiopsis confluens]
MLSSLIPSWRSRSQLPQDLEANHDNNAHLTRAALEKQTRPTHPKLQLNTSIIGPPIRRSAPSATGLDATDGQWHPSPSSSSRSGPSNIAWLRQHPPQTGQELPSRPPAARLGMMVRQTTSIPVGRSVSSPAYSAHVHPALSLGMNPVHVSSSTHSLRAEPRPRVSTIYGDAYDHPRVKPLSPIVEQDYFSPESLRHSIPLPPESALSRSVSTSVSSPAGSQSTSRPSPVSSIPFIIRPINRSLSQSTHRSALSIASTVAPYPTTPLYELDASPLEECDDGDGAAEYSSQGEMETLHDADSFVTAEDASPVDSIEPVLSARSTVPSLRPDIPPQVGYPPISVEFTETDVSMICSDGTSILRLSTRSPPSASESFIRRRWDRDAAYPSIAFKLKAKRQSLYTNVTPAFFAFWMGFVFPVLWLIGGWHFTHFGEQPARLTFWEFYFNGAYWKELLCCGRGKLRWEHSSDGSGEVGTGKGKSRERPRAIPAIPRWITEKQSTDVKKARLNDANRSLKGISFGYPFVPRPFSNPATPLEMTVTRRAMRRIMVILCKPHQFFDQFHGVRLTNVKGKREAPRRMFDPWIQRCRYALIYLLIILLAGLATATICLVVFSLRNSG